MSAPWRDDEEELRAGGMRGGLKSKPRFSFTEVKLLLEAVKRNRYIILRKFNQGVSAETKKQTWAEITNQINGLGENHREVRQIMKKWADLKCDGKRRIIALRGPNSSNLRKKNLGPVERMVHKILTMSPRGDGESDPEFGEDDAFSKLYNKGPSSNQGSYSYLNLTDSSYPVGGGGGGGGSSFDISPLSSPDKDLGGDPFHSSSDFDLDMADDRDHTMDFEENDDVFSSSYPDPPLPPLPTSLDPLPDDALLRMKPVHTYSRNSSQNHASSRPQSGPSTSSSVFPSASDVDASLSSAAPPPSEPPASSNKTASSVPPTPPPSSIAPPPPASSAASAAATDSTSQSAPSTSSIPPPPPAPPASSVPASSCSSSVAPTLTTAPSSSAASSNSHQPSPPSSSSSSSSSFSVLPPSHPSTFNLSDPLPAGASSRRARDHVAQMANQSLEQQRASRMLLTSVSQSLEVLAQSVQLLVETQQEFVQESLLLQRETVDILRDFSNTALTMLRDKANSGQLATHHHHHHPASRF